jgi:hypothetical protein
MGKEREACYARDHRGVTADLESSETAEGCQRLKLLASLAEDFDSQTAEPCQVV